jgi:rare lipoprotein A
MQYKFYGISLTVFAVVSTQLTPALSTPVTPVINNPRPKPQPALTVPPKTTPPIPQPTPTAPPKTTPPSPQPSSTTITNPIPQSSPAAIPTSQPSPTTPATTTNPNTTSTTPPKETVLFTQIGEASWYGSEGGPLTATGERYNPQGMTAAHRTIAFGSRVRVTNLRSGRSAIVTINDRGPYAGRRIIDLSAAAAAAVGIKSSGVGQVRIEVLSYGSNKRKVRK